MCPQRGHPCQKHPSTKTATCFLLNKKSGVPGRVHARTFQPLTRFLMSSARSRSSVVLLEPALIARMFRDRNSEVSNFKAFDVLSRCKVAQSQRNICNRLIG